MLGQLSSPIMSPTSGREAPTTSTKPWWRRPSAKESCCQKTTANRHCMMKWPRRRPRKTTCFDDSLPKSASWNKKSLSMSEIAYYALTTPCCSWLISTAESSGPMPKVSMLIISTWTLSIRRRLPSKTFPRHGPDITLWSGANLKATGSLSGWSAASPKLSGASVIRRNNWRISQMLGILTARPSAS